MVMCSCSNSLKSIPNSQDFRFKESAESQDVSRSRTRRYFEPVNNIKATFSETELLKRIENTNQAKQQQSKKEFAGNLNLQLTFQKPISNLW